MFLRRLDLLMDYIKARMQRQHWRRLPYLHSRHLYLHIRHPSRRYHQQMQLQYLLDPLHQLLVL